MSASISNMQRPSMRPKKNTIQAQGGLAIQQAASQIPATQAPTPQVANTIGAGVAQQQGQASTQQAQNVAQQNVQAGQHVVANQQSNLSADIAARKNELARKSIENNRRLSALSEEAQNKIQAGKQLFERRKNGQKFLNERALATFALTQAKDQRDYDKWAQEAKQASEKKLALLEIAHKKIEQAIRAEYIKDRQSKDHRMEQYLIRQRTALERSMEREAADAANKNSLWSTGLGIATAVGVGVVSGGNPVMIGAAYQIGSGAGSVVASRV